MDINKRLKSLEKAFLSIGYACLISTEKRYSSERKKSFNHFTVKLEKISHLEEKQALYKLKKEVETEEGKKEINKKIHSLQAVAIKIESFNKVEILISLVETYKRLKEEGEGDE